MAKANSSGTSMEAQLSALRDKLTRVTARRDAAKIAATKSAEAYGALAVDFAAEVDGVAAAAVAAAMVENDRLRNELRVFETAVDVATRDVEDCERALAEAREKAVRQGKLDRARRLGADYVAAAVDEFTDLLRRAADAASRAMALAGELQGENLPAENRPDLQTPFMAPKIVGERLGRIADVLLEDAFVTAARSLARTSPDTAGSTALSIVDLETAKRREDLAELCAEERRMGEWYATGVYPSSHERADGSPPQLGAPAADAGHPEDRRPAMGTAAALLAPPAVDGRRRSVGRGRGLNGTARGLD